jgi:tetratricopeptide (TPR) repeat protein
MSDVEGNRRLEEIAATVADGGHVDWRRALVENPRLTAPLTGLRKLAELRSAFGHLAGPSETVSEADHEDTVPVSRLWGHLEVRELLGSGSFGSVYRVFDPVLRREVALKLFRSEMAHADSGSLMDEARALARVRHRNVLAVHGADLHDGRMGLWTDLVAGQTLESQIEAGPLTRQRQMEVALDLVAALEAVHGAGLVHGDVKAANVMIEGQGADAGRAVLMDFGAARTRDHAGERVGSPLSMAPELFAGEPASAAADVYALGVILYRMASGRYPVSATTLEELADLHRTRRARLSFEARAWRRTPLELRRVIEALLDPSPEGRPTAAQAGQRLRHVQSAPQRRRRRLAVAVIVTSLLAGTIASSIAYLRARRSQAVALAAREEAEAVNEFLEDVLSSPRSSVGGRQVTVTELLERSESLVEDRFADQPSARGRALLMLGETQAQLGSWDEGETLLRRATTMLHQARGAEDPLTLRADLALARTLRSRAEHSPKEQAEPARQDARALLVDVLAHADRALPVAHPLAVSVRTELAAVARSQQDIPEAERWARAALARSEGAPWAETQERILAQVELSAVLTAQGKFAEAETLLRPTVDWFEDVYGARHSSTLASRQRLAIALIQQGKEVEAEPILREDVATTREWLGPDDEITLEAVAALSNNLHSQRRTAEALELSREVSDMARRIYGEDDPNTLMFLGNQANRLMELEEWDQAEAIYRNVIEGLAAAVGADHRWTLVTKANLAELLLDTKRPREARLLADAAAEGLAKLYPPRTPLCHLRELPFRRRPGDERRRDRRNRPPRRVGPTSDRVPRA